MLTNLRIIFYTARFKNIHNRFVLKKKISWGKFQNVRIPDLSVERLRTQRKVKMIVGN